MTKQAEKNREAFRADVAQHTYETSFAYWYPIYKAAWASRGARERFYARQDIEKTLEAQQSLGRTPYVGKLYAELDAIRDVALEIIRRYRNRMELSCRDCGEPGERAGHQTCQYPQNA